MKANASDIDVVPAALLPKAEFVRPVDALFVLQDGVLKQAKSADYIVSVIAGAPVFDSDDAAGEGGLTSNQLYKTTTGELRYKLPENDHFTYIFPFNLG